jgi:hypothetical protein
MAGIPALAPSGGDEGESGELDGLGPVARPSRRDREENRRDLNGKFDGQVSEPSGFREGGEYWRPPLAFSIFILYRIIV